MSQESVDFVIITPLEEERTAMLAHLGNPRRLPPEEQQIRPYYRAQVPVTFSDGTPSHYTVVVSDLLGMGGVQAANAVGDAIRRWQPRYVLLVGIAGGWSQASVQLGDVLIADQVADYELQKLRNDSTEIRWRVFGVDQRLLGATQQMTPDEWRPLIREPRPEAGTPNRRVGVICTGNKVIANDLLKQYHHLWAKLIGVEMEAGGAASAASQSGRAPGFFMIRGVSDLADPAKDDQSTQSWREYACDVAAAYTLGLLKSGQIPPASLPHPR
jgi:nucleoside phosphorylase